MHINLRLPGDALIHLDGHLFDRLMVLDLILIFQTDRQHVRLIGSLGSPQDWWGEDPPQPG